MKIIALIPARGGSKGIPRKNIIDVGGKPLVAWSIEASLNSKYVTKTVVSSEDKEILDISKKFGAVIVKRPRQYSTDESPTEPVIVDCLSQLKRKGEK